MIRLTATSERLSFLGAIGCTRPRPLSPRFGGSSPSPTAAGAGITAAVVTVWLAGAGFEGARVTAGAAGAGVSVCAIGASTTSAAGSATFSASALASASKQDTVASQWPRFTSLAVCETWQQ